MKIQQVRSPAICNIVDDLRKMSLIKEPGKDVETFGSQVIEKTSHIIGSGPAPSNITSIFAQCFIECSVLAFKLKTLQFCDIVDDNHTGM